MSAVRELLEAARTPRCIPASSHQDFKNRFGKFRDTAGVDHTLASVHQEV